MRIAARLAPVQDQLTSACSRRGRRRVLDVGRAPVRSRSAPPYRGDGEGDRHRRADAREGAPAGPRRVKSQFDLGDVEYLPVRRCELRRRSLSNFGAGVRTRPRERRRRARSRRRPGARLGFSAWKPNPKLSELYRRFTEEPLEGREAYEWGREDHVEDMLGDDFELEYEDGTLWIEAESAEEVWKLFSESAPPVVALARS